MPSSYEISVLHHLISLNFCLLLVTLVVYSQYGNILCLRGTLSSKMSLLSVEFRSLHNNGEWILTNVYGPCTFEIKRKFTLWLKHIQMPDDVEWLLHGDSNLSRDPGNRSKPCGDLA